MLHVFTLVANIFFSIYKLLSLTCIVGICAPALGSCTPFKPPKFQLTNAFFKMCKGTSSGQQRSCPHGSLHSRTWTGLGTPGRGYCCCLYIINWLGQPKDCLEPLTISRCFRMAFHPFAHVALANGHHGLWDHTEPCGTTWGLLVDLVLIIIEQGFGVRHSLASNVHNYRWPFTNCKTARLEGGDNRSVMSKQVFWDLVGLLHYNKFVRSFLFLIHSPSSFQPHPFQNSPSYVLSAKAPMNSQAKPLNFRLPSAAAPALSLNNKRR